MREPREVLREVLTRELGNARDNIIRAEAQLKRMEYDHDTRAALDRYREWEAETKATLTFYGFGRLT